MEKVLLNNDQELIQLLLKLTKRNVDPADSIETILGIEFPTKSGKYVTDYYVYEDTSKLEDENKDTSKFRSEKDSNLPYTYPCIASYLTKRKDSGDTHVTYLNYVYMEDFNPKQIIRKLVR